MNTTLNSDSRSPQKTPTPPGRYYLIWPVLTATGCRLLLNTARRFAYPFAPALSRGLQVPLTSVTAIIAVMQLTGILGVAGGPLTDRWGYRRMMRIGMGMMAVGLLLVCVAPFYLVVMAGLFLAGFAKNVFDPAIYGYLGQRVPFSRRGRVTGILETAWAGSALVGIPIMGFLIEGYGWQAPFWCLGLMAVVGMALLSRVVPAESPQAVDKSPSAWGPAWKGLLRQREAMGLLGFVFFASMGNDQLFVVYGVWMERTFSMGITAIGLGTGIIGIAELLGEGLTAMLGDRIELKRATGIGTLLAAAAYGVLPFMDSGVIYALVGLFTVFLLFEFSIVCGISLSTEALPGYRATMMAAFFGAAGIGRVFGAMIGQPIWLAGGITAVCMVSAGASLLSLICLLWGFGGRGLGTFQKIRRYAGNGS